MSKASRKERRKALASQYAASHPVAAQSSTEPPVSMVDSFPEGPLSVEQMKARYKALGLPGDLFDPPDPDSDAAWAVEPVSVDCVNDRTALPSFDPAQPTSRHRGGPTTPEGKARSAQNSFRHGLTVCGFSHFKLLPGEDAAEYADLCADVRAQFVPQTPVECLKIQDMAQAWWLQRRARGLQTAALQEGNEKAFALYLRYETTQRRSYQMAFKDFQEMQKARLAQRAASATTSNGELGSFQSERIYASPQPITQPVPEAPAGPPLAA